MKKISYVLLVILSLIAAVAMQSCYTKKPLGKATPPDYNQRVNVTEAQLKKKGNAINVVFKVSLTGAGGTLGYVYPLKVDGKPMPGATAAIGAAGGLALSYVCDAIMGKGKVKPVTDPMLWIKKSKKDFKLNDYRLLSGSGQAFTIMHPSVEMNYTVKNIQDVRDFNRMFPNSSYTDKMFLKAVDYLPRNDLPELIALYPNNKYSDDAKTAYIKKSSSFGDALAAAKRYPVHNADELCASLVATTDNAISFFNQYSFSNYKKTALMNAFKRNEPTRQEMLNLKNTYGDMIYLKSNDNIQNTDILKNYYGGMYNLINPSSFEQFYDFTERYEWISLSNKKQMILSKYWDMNDKLYEEGYEVIWNFKTILIEPLYKKYNISEFDIKEVMKLKFQYEVENNVVILSEKTLGQNTPEWENWKRSRYTAGIVQQSEKVNYIVYGEIFNDSKFDLSVILKSGGVLQETKSVKGQGWLGALGTLFGVKVQSESDVAGVVGECYFPIIFSGQREVYAVLLDFGVHMTNQGINMADIVKFASEIRLKETKTKVFYTEEKPTRYQLEKQEDLRYIVLYEGIPDGKLTDLVRGEEVRQDIWNMRKQILEDEKEKRRIERARNRAIEEGVSRGVERYLERKY
jgi:hypothetical protein